MIRLDALLAELLGRVKPLPPVTIDLSDASIASLRGRSLAAPILATLDLPRVDVSAMDGWAVRSDDLSGATSTQPIPLRVVGDAAAGRTTDDMPLEAGSCVRIATGAPIPIGSDAVVVVERTYSEDPRTGASLFERSPVEIPNLVWFVAPIEQGAAIRRRGEDVVRGATLLDTGVELDPAAIGLLAGSGAREVTLAPRPRIAILSSGDELGDATTGSVAIPDSNGPMLELLLADAGAEIVGRWRVADSASATRAMVATTAASCDLLISSGGVSLGAHDHIGTALAEQFEVMVRAVAMQPGKPLFVGWRRSGSGAAWALGLPGNPVSAFVTATLVAAPLVAKLAGRWVGEMRCYGRLTAPIGSPLARRSFPRLRAERTADGAVRCDAEGTPLVAPLREQGSHQASALARCDYLGDIPEECEHLDAGDLVALIPLPRAARRLAPTER